MADQNSSSEALFERAKQLIPGGVNSPVRAFRSVGGTPFFTKRAEGARLHTVDGRELIDFVCTWGPAVHGHNHPVIRAAVAEALEAGTSFGTPNPYEVEMAEWITRLVPSVERVRCCNSGTEATMSCIRLARGFTGRDKIVKFAGCYHGHVDSLLVKAGSGALTLGNPDSAGVPASFAAETLVIPYNDPQALDALFYDHGEEIAGVIVESYPANCGLILPREGYLKQLRDLCTRHGAVMIFDEVMTGFRLAPGGVQEIEGITPDLTAMGKVIGGGLPVGAFGGRADIMAKLAPEGPVYQAGTLSGNPLAMAAGIAAIQLLVEKNPYARLDAMGRRLADALRGAAKQKGLPLQVPQTGSMLCLFFAEEPVVDYDDAVASGTAHFKKLFHLALEAGVYLAPSPFETLFISTAHEGADIDRACEVLAAAVGKL
ncbi:MAG: glutamate-1-semialdehyde 2,1-aminomutase [Opitutales bacterium]|nr:glutamate-1-semialdehyde 2,1-aminomutase [Opitutales bacterium]